MVLLPRRVPQLQGLKTAAVPEFAIGEFAIGEDAEVNWPRDVHAHRYLTSDTNADVGQSYRACNA